MTVGVVSHLRPDLSPSPFAVSRVVLRHFRHPSNTKFTTSPLLFLVSTHSCLKQFRTTVSGSTTDFSVSRPLLSHGDTIPLVVTPGGPHSLDFSSTFHQGIDILFQVWYIEPTRVRKGTEVMRKPPTKGSVRLPSTIKSRV